MVFLQILQQRNKWLYLLGCLLFFSGIICLGFLLFDNRYIDGISLWNFPFRFTLGSGIYVFTMGWLTFLINNTTHRKWITFSIFFTIAGFFFLVIVQLLNGTILLYADQNPFDHLMNLMSAFFYCLFLVLQIILTVIFFRQKKNLNSQHYTWGVRMALATFTVFHFFILVLFFWVFKDFNLLIDWLMQNKLIGYDIQLSFYLGIHAIQIIPIFSNYLFETKKQVVFFSISYLGLIMVLLLSFILRTH